MQVEVVFEAIDTDGITNVALTVIGLLDAITGLAHGSLLLIVTVTTSPLFKDVVIKVDAVCPVTFTLFIFH